MPDPAWQPTASIERLRQRADLLWQLRWFFHQQGFDEVSPPVLSADTVVDRYIEPIEVPAAAVGIKALNAERLFLQSSPEFALKRLLAAGMRAIYSIGPAFRAAERGQFHNSEFTMLEWYRVGDDLHAAVELLASLVTGVLPTAKPIQTTYRQAFARHTGCDPLDVDLADFVAIARAHGLQVASDWSSDRDGWLNLLFAEIVQPRLGATQPEIVTHYPATQSALAKLSDEDPQTAERFELFINGIELANGYHELTDADELRQRNRGVAEQRAADGAKALPQESRLLAAMQAGLPPCSGCAVGLDRLSMVLSGEASLDDVIPFPVERA